MGMHISFTSVRNERQQNAFFNLLEKGRNGDAVVLHPDFGFKYQIIVVIKRSKNAADLYIASKWYWTGRDQFLKKPAARATKDHITFFKSNVAFRSTTSHKIGNYHAEFRAFATIGCIRNIAIRTLRGETLIQFKNRICSEGEGAPNNPKEIATHNNMRVTYDGKLISNVSKKVKKYTFLTYRKDRDIQNANYKSNYANIRVLKLMREAENLNDWSKVKPLDVFSLRNVSNRTRLIEHFGIETILNELDPEVVDSQVINNNEYQLLRFRLPIKERFVPESRMIATYLKMINPSTGEVCIEGVPNNSQREWSTEINMMTVGQALAWRDGDVNGIYNVPIALT